MGNLLVPFKKFLSNKNTITILGVLIGLVVLYLGYSWRVTQSIQPTSVPYCKNTLLARTKITADDIGYTDLPKDVVSKMGNIKTQSSDIVGKVVAYDGKIAQNSFFYDEQLMKEEDMPNSIFSNIQDGYTIYALAVDTEKTHANSIMPDTLIDLYVSSEVEEDEDKVLYGRFIANIGVLAVRDKKGKNVFADKDNPLESAYLLFAVPEDIFLLLKKAEKLDIDIEPTARNDSYTANAEPTKIVNDEIKAFIINQTHILANECTDLTIC